MSEDTILSYHDVLIRKSDLQTLERHSWLNDIIIGFYFEYLEREKCAKGQKVVFASPELTQLLKLVDVADYAAIVESRITQETDFIFFPLNNCDDREDPGGAHWSLLIFSRPEASCFHLDSSGGFNTAIARDFSKKILEFMTGSSRNKLSILECPQQNNSYDCGIFVLCLAETLLSHLLISGKIQGVNFEGVSREVKTARQRIQDLIREIKCRENR